MQFQCCYFNTKTLISKQLYLLFKSIFKVFIPCQNFKLVFEIQCMANEIFTDIVVDITFRNSEVISKSSFEFLGFSGYNITSP